ncbi:MAG TPA: hypothetical protein V6D02_13470, partial [Candidatus Obscuribacterales bacterium]
AQLKDQAAALRLAICDDIGQAAYDNQRIAVGLVELLREFEGKDAATSYIQVLGDRYDLPLGEQTGESYLQKMAEVRYQGDIERAARSLIHDYRVGHLGSLSLEWPPPAP